MHIVYITVEFVSERKPCGGLGHYLANIATIMAERGHQVTILVQTDHGGGVFLETQCRSHCVHDKRF